jgi:hypothetical protein
MVRRSVAPVCAPRTGARGCDSPKFTVVEINDDSQAVISGVLTVLASAPTPLAPLLAVRQPTCVGLGTESFVKLD